MTLSNMRPFSYLSAPYTSPDAATRERRVAAACDALAYLIGTARLVVCPVLMMHAAAERMRANSVNAPRSYWLELEARMAAACDELVVLQEEGWRESRGVAREIALFELAGKPVIFLPAPRGAIACRAPRPMPITDVPVNQGRAR